MSMSTAEVEYNIRVNFDSQVYSDIKKLETSLIRISGYLIRLSGNESLTQTLRLIQDVIIALRSLQIAMRAVQAASGPVGWIYAATTVAAVGFTGLSMYETMRGV